MVTTTTRMVSSIDTASHDLPFKVKPSSSISTLKVSAGASISFLLKILFTQNPFHSGSRSLWI